MDLYDLFIYVILVGAWVLVFAIVVAAYWFLEVGPKRESGAKLRQRLKTQRAVAARSEGVGVLKEAERLSAVAGLDRLLVRAGRVARPLQRAIAQAGLRTTVGTFLLASGVSGLLVYWVIKSATDQPALAFILGATAATGPYGFVRRARRKRLHLFEEQFPAAIDLIARALRAGHAFPTGLKLVADELPSPVGAEFRLLHDQQNYGLALPDALKGFADRIPIIDARFFVTAVLTQREAGGNLSEVLDHLSAVIRDRFRVRKQVRVMSAHGRMTGFIIAALAPVLAGVMLVVAPQQIYGLVRDPLGLRMVIGAVVLQIIGTVVIRRLVEIEY